MRALILGHFSTIGDIDSLAYVTRILRQEGVPYDVLPYLEKLSADIEGAIGRHDLDASAYTHLIVVCGPFSPDLLARRGIDLEHFAHCTRIGVNLTMIEPIAEWNPFHLLLERDSDRSARPDLTFLEDSRQVPVAGLCIIKGQREYGERQRHAEAIELMRRLLDQRRIAVVEIDTRWPASRNSGGLGTAEQVSSVMARMDVVLTNRLHGMVYALKAGTPVLAIDPIEGGDKVIAQGKVLGWPAVLTVDAATPARLERLLDWCLSQGARQALRPIPGAARDELQPVADHLRAALRRPYSYKPLPPAAPHARFGFMRPISRLLRRAWR